MPILTGDIQLLASERLSDTFDGGGRMTGRVIVDGQSNNLFPDISELDRTYGRVSLRKCFVGVLTDSTDSYFGAHAIVADAPDDPRVAVTLFTTRSWVDQREAAKDRIERYLARGVRWPGQLLERQLTGQRAIALLLKAGDPLPRVGQTLVLVQDEARPTEVEQYVRITRISTVEREFQLGQDRFRGTVATCEIADALRYDFDGPAPLFRDDGEQRAVARDTVVANAAVYFGVQPTVAPAGIGDLRVVAPPVGSDVYMLARLWNFWPILELEKDQTYRLHLTSMDYNHGFSLQPANINIQVVPGYEHVITVTPNQSGQYSVVCNEYCGIGHHTMVGRIYVK